MASQIQPKTPRIRASARASAAPCGRGAGWTSLVCALAMLTAGCLSPRPQTSRSFALRTPTAPAKDAPLGAPVVRVRDLEPAPVVDRDVLVVRKGAVEVTLQDDLRWAERPHRMVANLVARALVDGGYASAATRDLGHGRPTLEIEGRLDTFEHDVSDGGSVARVAMVLAVRGFDDGERKAHHRYSAELRCANDPASAVRALSDLVDAGIHQALDAFAAAGAFAKSAPAAP